MPNFAYVKADLGCPSCGAPQVEFARIQWGYCALRFEADESMYAVGDAIRWRTCTDGSIRPWTYFEQGRYPDEANIGDPAFTDLIVRDAWGNYEPEAIAAPHRCAQCQEIVEGPAVEIRSGIIRRAWMVRPGELGAFTTHYLLVADAGALQPMPEWEMHVMDEISSC